MSYLSYKLTITEWDDSGKKGASGTYQDTGPSVTLEFKPDVTGFQVRALGKHIKRLAQSKVKVQLESEEEITEIK